MFERVTEKLCFDVLKNYWHIMFQSLKKLLKHSVLMFEKLLKHSVLMFEKVTETFCFDVWKSYWFILFKRKRDDECYSISFCKLTINIFEELYIFFSICIQIRINSSNLGDSFLGKKEGKNYVQFSRENFWFFWYNSVWLMTEQEYAQYSK